MIKLLAKFLTGAYLLTAASAPAASLMVFAPVILTDSLREVARGFAEKTGTNVDFNFASTSVLTRQLEEGTPADIFFSSDEGHVDALARASLVDKTSRHVRLSNSLVIIVPAEHPVAVHGPSDLALDSVHHVAIADTRGVPLGIQSMSYLRKVNVWDKVQQKITPMDSGRAVLSAVESGKVEAGIVYKTDAVMDKKVIVACEAPKSETPKIDYPEAILSASRQPAAARAFLSYVDSEAAAQIFRRHGFTVDSTR